MYKRERPKAAKASKKRRTAAKAARPDANGRGQAVSSFVPQTELGRHLWELRQRIVASGQPLLDWKGIERELRERSGEAIEEAGS